MLGTCILLLFIIYMVVYVLLKYTVFNYWKKRNVPFVKPNFIFGNVWEVINLNKTWSTFVDDIHKTYTNERYIGIFNMFQPALVIRDLDIIKDVLIKDFDSFHDNWYTASPDVDPILSRTPFVRNGKEWKDTRTLLSGQFTTAKIKQTVPLLQKVCDDMIEYIDNQSNIKKSTCLELIDLCSRFTGDVVMSCGYSLEAKTFHKKAIEMFYMIDANFAYTPSKLTKLKRTLGLMFQFFGKLFKVTFLGDAVPQLFPDIIKSATENRVLNNITRNDYLNYLIELKNKRRIADSDIAGYAYAFFLEGFETSYSAMCYALLALSMNPKVQKAAQNEVDIIIQKYGKISFEAYKKLVYLERTLMETLRINPAIKVMSKNCTADFKIEDPDGKSNIIIKKGTPVFCSIDGIHQNPKYYPEPEKFDPNRFTEEAKQLRPKCSFLGFGEGPRICLGRKFAMVQVVFGMAAILSKFELRFNEKTALPVRHDAYHIGDVPVSELYVDFIPRSKYCSIL